MTIIFWVSAGLLVFHYLGYPMLMGLLARIVEPISLPVLQEFPSVTLVISAYNEEGVIKARLDNSLNLDYPRESLNILVVSDGSTDGTHSIVQDYHHQGISLREIQGRVGKTAALNTIIPELGTDIAVFTDANSMLQPDAIKKLVRHFADPSVGAACGELQLTGDTGAEGTYWRYERAIKLWESRVSTLTVLNGAIYALRVPLHKPMNPQAANDFQHPLQVALQGYRCVYEPLAIAWESAGKDESVEVWRRVRIISRGWKGLFSNLYVLNPLRMGSFSLQFTARKILRWLGPILMIIALGANISLAMNPGFYRVTLALQIIFYSLAIIGWVLNKFSLKPLPAYLPYYFCLINWAALKALIRVLMGRDSSVWTPTTNIQLKK